MRYASIAAFGLLVLAAIAVPTSPTPAHEVPSDARLNVFVAPRGERLEILVRVPAEALRDIDYPRRGAGFLDAAAADPALRGAITIWIVDQLTIKENGRALGPARIEAVRVALPSDRSFQEFATARAAVTGTKPPPDQDLVWSQLFVDALLSVPITSDKGPFAVRLAVDRLAGRVTTALRYLPPGGAGRALEFHGDPGEIELDPTWRQSAWTFGREGFWHIPGGLDHLAFLACLVLAAPRLGSLVGIVTAFTVGHSLSLVAATLGYVPDKRWFPPLVETAIAATILWMAIELALARGSSRRWAVAFAFGTIHGLGFAFGLRESLQFAGDNLAAALIAFNVGVEIGQIAALAVMVPLASLALGTPPRRLAVLVAAALIGHAAWHWLIERGAELAKFPPPALDTEFVVMLLEAATAIVALAGLVWAFETFVTRRWSRPPNNDPAPADKITR